MSDTLSTLPAATVSRTGASAQKTYNPIFETLMARACERVPPTPVLGYLAYGLYKKQKAEWLAKRAKENLPTSADAIEHFHEAFTDQRFQDLEASAANILTTYSVELVESEIAARRQSIVDESVVLEVASIRRYVNDAQRAIEGRTRFRDAFWPGVASSTFFFVVTGVMGVLWALGNVDFLRNTLAKITTGQ